MDYIFCIFWRVYSLFVVVLFVGNQYFSRIFERFCLWICSDSARLIWFIRVQKFQFNIFGFLYLVWSKIMGRPISISCQAFLSHFGFSSRCSVASSEQVAQLLLGWYSNNYQNILLQIFMIFCTVLTQYCRVTLIFFIRTKFIRTFKV